MTYTVAIRSPQTHEIGVGITTCSIAFGGQAPFYTPAGDLIISQAFASRDDGFRLAAAIAAGQTIEAGFDGLRLSDPDLSYRQIFVVPVSGSIFAHTGENPRPWRGHIVGPDFVCAGNVLAGAQVVEAMAASVRASIGEPLADRLLHALEAGREAGGQAAGGAMLTERSAMLRITRTGEMPGFPQLDLRVDMHASALHEMRRLLKFYRVYDAYAQIRDKSPASSPSMVDYEARHLSVDGELIERPSVYR